MNEGYDFISSIVNTNNSGEMAQVTYKHIPVSVFDVEEAGKNEIRKKQDHNKVSSRATYSPFPEDVAEWCAEYFLRDSQTVFDPFAGWGQRHKAIINKEKQYIGYDISPQAIQYAKDNFNVDNILADSRTADIPEHDGLLTCPPYWNLEKYQADGLDKIKEWNDFLVEYEKVWKRVIEKAKTGSKYCIVLGDWRKKGIYYDFVYQTEKIMDKLGMKPFDKVILSTKKQSKIKVMLPQAKRLGYTVKVHQILLIFTI
jgi:DNA modification methylase